MSRCSRATVALSSIAGRRVANVPDRRSGSALLEVPRVPGQGGGKKLGEKKVDIVPPDPIGELGSGFERIASGAAKKVQQVTVGGRE